MFHYYIKGLYFHWIISVKGQEVESLVDIIDHFIVKGVSLRISCEHLGWFINQNLLWMLQSCKGFGWDMTGKGVSRDQLPRGKVRPFTTLYLFPSTKEFIANPYI